MRSVLVTGGDGFIGRHLVGALLEKGLNVTVLVENRKNIPASWGGAVKVCEGNITDRKSLEGIDSRCDTVFHLASYVHMNPKSEAEKKYVFKVNVEGTRNLLDSLGLTVEDLVFISSVSVYGVSSGLSIDETVSANPVSIYGITKFLGEKMIGEWGRQRQCRTTSLRLPLVYGPGNKGNILRMIRAIDKGYFVMLGDGRNMRSMVYVGNVVDASLSVTYRNKTNSEVYIVTDGCDYTLADMYRAIATELGKRQSPISIPASVAKGLCRLADVLKGMLNVPVPLDSEVFSKLTGSLTFSFSKISREVGFEPRYNLHDTIKEIIYWYVKNRR